MLRYLLKYVLCSGKAAAVPMVGVDDVAVDGDLEQATMPLL